MADPRRLLTEGDAFERELIAAGVDDGPRNRSARRVASALGLGAAALGTAGAATGATASLPMATTGVTVVKWIVILALGASAIGGVVHVARSGASDGDSPTPTAPLAAHGLQSRPSTPTALAAVAPSPSDPVAQYTAPVDPAPRATTATRPSAQAAPAQVPSLGRIVVRSETPAGGPPARSEPASSEVGQPAAATTTVEVDTPAVTPATSPSVQAPVRPSRLSAEMGALEEARAAVRLNEPAQALRTLDAYDAAFPNGMLAQEATVLRIEVLLRSSDGPGAARLARAFLVKHPESPLVPRVRAMIATMTNP